MKRFGKVIRLKLECLEEYKEYHANLWPEVREVLHAHNIHNYSIYYHDGYLFSYFEHSGEDVKADMARAAPHPRVKEWHRIMSAMQEPLQTNAPGVWWADMEEVFHLD
jgi:L-rhamnose mutarotase